MATRTMQVSEFKAKCIATLKRVEKTREPVDVTLRGVAIARVVPLNQGRRLGALEGTLDVKGEIVQADFTKEWELE